MMISYAFVRDDPSPEDRKIWRIQETSCFVVWAIMLTLFALQIRPIENLIQIYATAVFIILLTRLVNDTIGELWRNARQSQQKAATPFVDEVKSTT